MFNNIQLHIRVRKFSYIATESNEPHCILALYLSFPINTEIYIQNKTAKHRSNNDIQLLKYS